MIDFEDLTMFIAFYKYKTLTKVAEEFNISQPTITRKMKRVEEFFGVPIFNRSVNKIEFNETGEVAAKAAIKLLESAESCKEEVIDFDKKLRTITVESCAPAPLWSFMPMLYRKYANKTITSKLVDEMDELEANLLSHQCNIAILTHPVVNKDIACEKYIEEHLSICVPPTHELARYSSITVSQINGYNCLLSSDIGFWSNFHKKSLPASKFFVQTDEEAFKALVAESSLPCFTTDLASDYFYNDFTLGNRISIPITDPEANVSYYVCYYKSEFPDLSLSYSKALN